MDHHIINKNFDIYLVTNPFSRKVTHLRLNSSISINFQSPDGQNYVSINGKGILIDDINLKTKYWKNEWTPFYNNIDTDCILDSNYSTKFRISEFIKRYYRRPKNLETQNNYYR